MLDEEREVLMQEPIEKRLKKIQPLVVEVFEHLKYPGLTSKKKAEVNKKLKKAMKELYKECQEYVVDLKQHELEDGSKEATQSLDELIGKLRAPSGAALDQEQVEEWKAKML